MALGIAELDVAIANNLGAQLVATFIGSIEAQGHIGIAQANEIIYQRTSITAQSGAVANNTHM